MRLKDRKTVGIIGLGYVGLPTALAIARAGHRVIGVDVNRERVRAVNSGKSFIAEIPSSDLAAVRRLPAGRHGNLSATTDWKEVRKCGVILITAPTPPPPNKTP